MSLPNTFSGALRYEFLLVEQENARSVSEIDLHSLFSFERRHNEMGALLSEDLNRNELMAEMKCLAEESTQSSFRKELGNLILRASEKAQASLEKPETKLSVVLGEIENVLSSFNLKNSQSRKRSKEIDLKTAQNPGRRKRAKWIRPYAYKWKKFRETNKRKSLVAPPGPYLPARAVVI